MNGVGKYIIHIILACKLFHLIVSFPFNAFTDQNLFFTKVLNVIKHDIIILNVFFFKYLLEIIKVWRSRGVTVWWEQKILIVYALIK